jgi:MYXO-CTERM domain-containing protein
MREALSRALDKYEDNAELREYIEQTLARPTAQQATTVALIRAAVGDRDSQGRLAAVVELDGELDLLAKTDRAWQTTRVAADALQELTLQQALAQSEAGLLYRQRITQLIAELDELTEHARASKFSIGPDADLPLGATTCDPTAATETGSTATTQTPAPPRAKGCGCRATDTGSGAVLCGLLLGVLALGRRRRRIPG